MISSPFGAASFYVRGKMIEVTRLNNTKMTINPLLVEYLEETPDTVVFFQSGHKLVIKEKTKEVADLFADFLSGAIRKGMK